MNKWFSLFPQGERDSFAAQAPRGAGGAGTHFAAAVFPHGADAGLRFPLRLFRRGRGLMISCRKLSAQAQAGAPLLCAGGADSPRGACVGAHRAKEISFALLSFSSLSVRATHFAAAEAIFFYDSFCSSELHLSLHFSFWPAKIEKRSKEKSAAHVSALKNRTGHYPPRNSRAESFQLIQNGL